jgi:hypothetical protein
MANNIGEGIHDIYRERAQKGGDILWPVKIKGQSELTEGISLHMSLKVFEDKKEMKLDEIKRKIREFGIKTPDSKKLRFKTTIFTSDRDGKQYYMLLVKNTDGAYEKFYDSMKHCGTVYEKFIPHITIDKGLYDKINEEGLKPEEVVFDNLSVEFGAGNTIYELKKSLGEDYYEVARENAFYVNSLFGSSVVSLPENSFKNWLKDNPNLEREILKKHEKRSLLHFGHDSALHNANHCKRDR